MMSMIIDFLCSRGISRLFICSFRMSTVEQGPILLGVRFKKQRK